MLSQGQIEEQIEGMVDALETLTEQYRDHLRAAANAEADYRLGYYKRLLRTKANGIAVEGEAGKFRKATDAEAQALATVANEDDFRRYKVSAAQAEATKQALFTMRSRLDSLRTLSANVRAQT